MNRTCGSGLHAQMAMAWNGNDRGWTFVRAVQLTRFVTDLVYDQIMNKAWSTQLDPLGSRALRGNDLATPDCQRS